MKPWLRRLRGALGIGLTWAAAWGGAGSLVTLGFLVRTGTRPDAPFAFMFSAAGFAAGVMFSGVLGLVDARLRFDQLSLQRVAAWGAAGGSLLAVTFVVAICLAGDREFLWNLLVVGPIFAAAASGSAVGSLALARRAHDREMLETAQDVLQVGRGKGEAERDR